MIELHVGTNVYFYDTPQDMHYDYPEAICVNGKWIATEEREEDKQ